MSSKQGALIGMAIALNELQKQIDRLVISDSIEGVFMAGYTAGMSGRNMADALNDFKANYGHDGSDSSED